MNLDQNAGIATSDDCLQLYNNYSRVGNLHGFTDEKLQYQKEILQYYEQLQRQWGFDKIFLTDGASDAICQIFFKIPDIYVYPGQHSIVDEYKKDEQLQTSDNVCLINLVNSATGEYMLNQCQDAISKFQYIILDISQAIGKVPIPKNKKIQGVLFSCKKIGGPFNSGFLIMTQQLYSQFFKKQFQEEDVYKTVQLNYKTINLPLFISAAHSVLQLGNVYSIDKRSRNKNIYNRIVEILQDINYVRLKLSDCKNLTYTSILFELQPKSICTKWFQNLMMENENILLGFEQACIGDKHGIMRISWNANLSEQNLDAIQQAFQNCQQLVTELVKDKDEIVGGGGGEDDTSSDSSIIENSDNIIVHYRQSRNKHHYKFIPDITGGFIWHEQNILNKINDNKFWLNLRWVPSHDQPPCISEAYKVMFNRDLLNQHQTVSLNIEPHTEQQTNEFEPEDIDYKNIFIRKRRLDKNLYINNDDCKYQLTIDNFKEKSMEVYINDDILNLLTQDQLGPYKALKKIIQITKLSDKLTKHTITYKNYPIELLQEIKIGSKLFRISLFNLKVLSILGGNYLSLAMLLYIKRTVKRGSKYIQRYNMTIPTFEGNFNNICCVSILQDFCLMKKIYPKYPDLQTKNGFDVQFEDPGNYKSYSQFYDPETYQYTASQFQEQRPLIYIFNNLLQENVPEIAIFQHSLNDQKFLVQQYPQLSGYKYKVQQYQVYNVWIHTFTEQMIITFYNEKQPDLISSSESSSATSRSSSSSD